MFVVEAIAPTSESKQTMTRFLPFSNDPLRHLLKTITRLLPSSSQASSSGLEILAAWGHLHRFPKEAFQEEEARALAELLQKQPLSWFKEALHSLQPLGWLSAFQAFQDDQEEKADLWPDDAAQIEKDGEDRLELFLSLDRFLLAFFAAEREASSRSDGTSLRQALDALEEPLFEAFTEALFSADTFLPLGAYAQAHLEAYRPDLFSAFPRLWSATSFFASVASAWKDSQPQPLQTKETP